MLNIALSGNQSLFEELWEYIVENYFSVDLPYLENFTVKSNALVSIRMVIIGITIGIIVASISTLYSKRYLGDFVRKIVYEECFDKDSAKTLYDLGYLKSPGVRGAVKTGGTLWRWVRCVEEDEFVTEINKKREEFEELHKGEKKPPKFKAPEFVRDCNTMHFYIPKEKTYAAEIKFDKQGANIGSVLLVSLAALILCAFACYIVPDAIKLVDNFITVVGRG
ncbi:MAG: hypothetical protein IJ345_07795 [Clostridia bacterium]|nr:hypothetical protein [Clostridia bacterium]